MSLSEFRSRLGLPDEADEAAVLAALDERLTTPPTPQPDPELVAAAAAGQEAQTTIAAMRGELTRVSGELAAIKAREAAVEKDAFFASALQSGRLRPADLKTWQARYDSSRDMVVDIVNSMAPGSAVPVAAAGRVGSPDEQAEDAEFAEFDRMFPPTYAPTSAKAV